MAKRSKITWLATSVVSGILVLAVIYAFAIFDPFKWGIVQSEYFTWEKFSTVKKGDHIGKVIELLGQPVWKPNKFSVMTTDSRDPCFSGDCKEYFFAGARWGASYKEAIVITDRNGCVLLAQARQE